MIVGILGIGEVGSAIKKFVTPKHTVLVKDLDRDELTGRKIDILHICIPYNDKFIPVVTEVIHKINPSLVIIESTVAVGTTRLIFESTKVPVAHSPVRGTHPNLLEGIKTFVKFIGPINKQVGKEVADYYQKLGVTTKIASTPEETELSKLLDTTYYAWNVVFCKEVKKISDTLGVDFETVYTAFNKTYNEGYKKLGKKQVIRPVLTPDPGGFGGHCLYENTLILEKTFGSDFANIVTPILQIGKKNEK